MNNSNVLAILLLVINFSCKGQEKMFTNQCEKCNIEIVALTKYQMDSLNEPILFRFLCTFDEKCDNNAEFSEYSNEILFEVLLKRPDLVIEVIDKYHISKKYILNILRHPVNDGIEVDKIKDAVAYVNTKSKTKEEIINNLIGK